MANIFFNGLKESFWTSFFQSYSVVCACIIHQSINSTILGKRLLNYAFSICWGEKSFFEVQGLSFS